MTHVILTINPGSTSTKVAAFEDDTLRLVRTVRHDAMTLAGFDTLWDQFEFRRSAVGEALRAMGHSVSEFAAVVGRGGLLKPVPGGTYRVNDRMLEDARNGVQGHHAANLGAGLAHQVAREGRAVAFVVDPISVDEFDSLARYSGHPLITRRSLSHALNIHAVARRVTAERGLAYDKSRLVVAHLGGGISVCPVRGGKIIDANDAASDGPFSTERTGGLPLQRFISICFSNDYTESETRLMVMGRGGLVAYLGTNDAEEVERRIAGGDRQAREVYQAMAYQIAKEIGAMAAVLSGRVEAVVLTGGLARSSMLTSWISEQVSFVAPISILPGEFEMEAMAEGALRVLTGEEQAREYT